MQRFQSPDIEKARDLVLRFGWNTTSYQLLNPGLTLWFSRTHDAVIGFVRAARTRVVAGAPVCAAASLPAVAAEFEHDAAREGEHVCYFAAEERLASLYQPSPAHAHILLGAQPVWNPAQWETIIASHASLRSQCNRARNKGVSVNQWDSDRAHEHPALQRCLQQWLSTRGLPPLHFLVEPNTLSLLDDRIVFVAERNGVPVGFLILSPIATRNGWLVEQFVRGYGAPNGTVELMLDAAMRWMTTNHADYVTMGLAPLSQRSGPINTPATPLWLRLLFAWLHAHGRRFYNFDGLDAFKAKCNPKRWDPVFAITTESRISPRAIYAIAGAFSAGHPIATVAHGIAKAAVTDAKRLVSRFSV